jgi:hypothetical protein
VTVRIGVADHLGWAIVVAVSPDGVVADRRRIALVEDGVARMPIHSESKRLDVSAASALVASVRASAARAAATAFDELAAALPAPVSSVSLRDWPEDFPADIAVQVRVPWEARADAVMYRQVLAEVARARGWEVHLYDAREVLGLVPDDVLRAPRAQLGPPWAKDHRVAFAAALLAEG